jgi:hypothetical protein
LTLFTKKDCSLCDEVKHQLLPFLRRVNYLEIDIKDVKNEKWFSKYRYEIPVLHLNNKLLFKNKSIDFKILDQILKEFESSSK